MHVEYQSETIEVLLATVSTDTTDRKNVLAD